MTNDPVNNPSHYTGKADHLLKMIRGIFTEDCDVVEMECIQAMVNMMNTVEEIRGFLRGNSFKYRWRYQMKAGIEDLYKARVYDKWLLKLEETIEEVNYPAPF